MKKQKLISLLLVTLFTYSCQHDEPVQQGTVQFSFNSLSSRNAGGRKQVDDVLDGASIIISIAKDNGDSVFTWKKIDLLKIGDHLTSVPLTLPPGNYILQDFLLVNAGDSVLFAAPRAGSPLASEVHQPLPIPFTVNVNTLSNTAVEVLQDGAENPEDFGYASFGVKVAHSSGGLSLAALIVNEHGQTNFTTAKASVLHGTDTVLNQSLKAIPNHFNLSGDSTVLYTLIIVKDGYGKFTKEFTLKSLASELDGQSLAVVLDPALTIRWMPQNSSSLLSPDIFFGGIKGSKFKIDWGDGNLENIEPQLATWPQSERRIVHTYAAAGPYFFTITGDIESLSALEFQEFNAVIDTLSVANLSGLLLFSMGRETFGSNAIDFSKNVSLETLSIPRNIGLTKLDISKNTRLISISLDEERFSTEVVNKVIDDLYASVLANGRRNGAVSLGNGFFSDPHGMIGPPSPEQVQKLQLLKDNYNWTVFQLN